MEALTGIFDSHAHYDDPAFDPDREELLASLSRNGVETVLTIGADLETSRAAKQWTTPPGRCLRRSSMVSPWASRS